MEGQFSRRWELHDAGCSILCGETAHFLASLCADLLWQWKGREETDALRVEMHPLETSPSDLVSGR